MKKALLNFLLTILLALTFSFFLPWWAVMVAAFMSGAIVSLEKGQVFIVPFFAIALFWILYALTLSSSNDFILAEKIALLLQLNGNVPLLLIVTGLIGGLAAGFAGIFGNQLRAVFFKTEK